MMRAAPSMQIFWISVKEALSDTFFFTFFFLTSGGIQSVTMSNVT